MFEEIYVGHVKQRLTGTKCPKCGRPADGATSIDDEAAVPMPEPGDYSVCLYCGSLNRYTEMLALETVDREEKRRMLRDRRMKELIGVASSLSQRKRREWQ